MREEPEHPQRRSGYRLLTLLVAGLCLLVTALVWQQARHRDEAALRAEFDFMADKTGAAIENHLQDNVQLLRGVAGLFAASTEVSRGEFHAYVASLNLQERYPGILGVGYSQVVPEEVKEAHLRRIRGEGFPSYAITPPGRRDSYTTILYLEPFSGRNLRAFGYDMFTEPVRRTAMARARDEESVAMTAMVRLVQETDADVQAGFLLYLPVYRNGAPRATVAERRSALAGWAYSPLRMKDLMRSILAGPLRETAGLIDVQVYDGDTVTPAALMFDSSEGHPRVSLFEALRPLQVAGQRWTVRVHSLPPLEARLSSEKGAIILGAGLGLSLLLTLLTWSLVRGNEKISASLVRVDRANRELAESEERFRGFYELGLIGMAVTSPDMRWLQVNDRLCAMLGYQRDELMGTTWYDLTHPDDSVADREEFRQILAGLSDGSSHETRFIRRDGETVQASVSLRCQRHPDGSVRQFLALIDDITERTHLELALQKYSESLESLVLLRTEELEKANRALELSRDQAEAANRAKSMFLAVMSHELRTPLNAILGLSEMLREGVMGGVDPEQRDALATIEESGRHLLAVITDILDLSKIEADRMDLELAPVNLEDLCQAALRFVREPAARNGIALTFAMRGGAETLCTDQLRLKQILVNLLGNAVKFTPEGGAISLEVEGDEARHEVRFIVHDTGIGISPDDLDRLFHPFVQVDSSLTRRYEGTGLGLALVFRLCELLGGSVTVASEVGQGSRFTVTLPWQEETGDAGSSPPPSVTAALPAAPLHLPGEPLVLLVEDSRASREMLREYLQKLACRVVTATTGIEAVAQVRDRHPDLVLMDIQLPVMDGLTAIRTVRALPPPVNGVPVIALTALAMPGDLERCLQAGADAYLGKPFRLQELTEKIAEVLGRGGGRHPGNE